MLGLFHWIVVGGATGRFINLQFTVDSFCMAIKNTITAPVRGLNSDRGAQHACNVLQFLLKTKGILCGMNRKDYYCDRTVAGSFFHTLKAALIHNCKYNACQKPLADIFEYIKVFDNRQRRHSYLGYLTPVEFEKIAKVA